MYPVLMFVSIGSVLRRLSFASAQNKGSSAFTQTLFALTPHFSKPHSVISGRNPKRALLIFQRTALSHSRSTLPGSTHKK